MKQNVNVLIFVLLAFVLTVGCGKKENETQGKEPVKKEGQMKKNKKTVGNAALPDFKKMQRIKEAPLCNIALINGAKIKDAKQPISIKGNTIKVQGWAVDRLAEKPAGGVYITVGNRIYKAKYGAIDRPDIAKAHNNKQYQKSGYIAQIPVKGIKKGVHELGIRILSYDKKKFYTVGAKRRVKIRI